MNIRYFLPWHQNLHVRFVGKFVDYTSYSRNVESTSNGPAFFYSIYDEALIDGPAPHHRNLSTQSSLVDTIIIIRSFK